MNKYILFIGMGDWDIPQLEIANNNGFKTIATNRNPSAPALKKADVGLIVDGKNIYDIYKNLIELNVFNCIEYIYSGTELFFTVATLAELLNIPWHSPLSAITCENKHLMRKAFINNKIPIPNGFKTTTYDELENKITEFTKNIFVIKPSDSLSAQGVSIIKDLKQLKSAFNLAIKYSMGKVIICEEYIEGSLHDINGILTNKGLIRLGINDKKAGPLPHAVVVEGSSPTTLIIKEQEKLYELFESACRAADLNCGPVKGDFIRDKNGELYAMEVAPRLHGPLGSLYIIPESLSINPFHELCLWLQNKSITQHDIQRTDFVSVCVAAEENMQKAKEFSQVIKILEKKGKANKNDWTSNTDVPIYVVYKGNNDQK